MPSQSRRNFVRSLATVPLALWLADKVHAATPYVRYDLASPEGQDMLRTYADAVAKMKAMAGKKPQGWLWQWYTHFVNGNTTKDAEISRLFGTTTSAARTLAEETWNTCQSHAGQDSNHFLPWHRMFVFYFEQIVREVSGRPDFTLPYWNYTSTDPAKRGIVPVEFRLPNDPLFGTLYRSYRNAAANAGQPIHQGQPGDQMDIAALMATQNYSNVGSVQGFCRAMDSGIHGRIHVLTGNAKNMGAVPYAAQDALFWVHHANVDRLWESWNRNGGQNPTSGRWLDREFVFADGKGQRVSAKLRDFFDCSALGYSYDRYVGPDGTEGSTSFLMSARATGARRPIGRVPTRIGNGKPAELGAGVVRSPLTLDTGIPATGLDPTGQRRSYLVLKDLHTWAQPETLYHVYIGPRGVGLGPRVYVGSIHFFDAEFHDHGHGTMADALGDNFYSFDVTEILQGVASGKGASRAPLEVAFVPGTRPLPGAKPLVASVGLVWQ